MEREVSIGILNNIRVKEDRYLERLVRIKLRNEPDVMTVRDSGLATIAVPM